MGVLSEKPKDKCNSGVYTYNRARPYFVTIDSPECAGVHPLNPTTWHTGCDLMQLDNRQNPMFQFPVRF